MSDYSDLIYLMGAMIVFSLLSAQTSRMFQVNNRVQLNAEIEYNAVSIAQNEIDEIHWMTSADSLNAYANTFPKQVPLVAGNDTLFYNVDLDVSNFNIPGSNISNKKVEVTVTNEYLKANNSDTTSNSFAKLQFVKSFD